MNNIAVSTFTAAASPLARRCSARSLTSDTDRIPPIHVPPSNQSEKRFFPACWPIKAEPRRSAPPCAYWRRSSRATCRLLVTFNHAIDGVLQNNPKARANPKALAQLDGYKRPLVSSLSGNLQRFGMERVQKTESLQEIIADMSEPADTFRFTLGGETVSFLCHAAPMGRKQTKAKPTPWNIGQPLTFPVIRPRIQRIANQTVDEAMRGPFQGKRSKRKK